MTVPLLADENIDYRIVHCRLQLRPELDIIRAQRAGLAATADPIVLARATEENRVLLTHDYRTMINDAYDRVRQGVRMPGVIAIPNGTPPRLAADEILLILDCSLEGELENQVRFVPL